MTISIILVGFLSVGFASLLIMRTIDNTTGKVIGVNIALYKEDGVTTLDTIAWGDCFPEQVYIVNGWVNNTANYDTVLSMATSDISPLDFLSTNALFEFNGTGQTVAKGSSLFVEYKLTILDTVTSMQGQDGYNFSFDIEITATSTEV